MSPWWLRPPADEAPANEVEPPKQAGKPRKTKETEPEEAKSSAGKRRSGRARSGKRRRTSSGKGRSKPAAAARLAVFYDVEGGGEEIDLDQILQRLSERGQIVAKRAFADWAQFSDFRGATKAAGFEIVELPPTLAGKSSVDIQLAVDAMDFCLSKDSCQIMVLISGEGGFHSLVTKLRQAKIQVLGVGARDTVSPGLAESCDEYFYLDELDEPESAAPSMVEIDDSKRPVFAALVEVISNLKAEGDATIWGSTLKQEMRRQQPGFDPAVYGYPTFTDLLEDAERHEVIHLERDDRSGGYYVVGIADR